MALTASAREGHSGSGLVELFLTMLMALAAAPRQLLTKTRKWIVELANDTAGHYGTGQPMANPDAHMGIMREVQLIGGAVIMIAVIVIVVNEVLTVDAVANSDGPFSGVITSLETTGVAAMTLLVVGLLVVAAMALMRYFNQWG
jgi:hypothetical protein